jgi:CBS domain containing-hemolysin-like protein
MLILIPLIIILLILVNAVYVAAEFAAVSVRRTRVAQLAQEGDAAARRLLPTLESPERLDRHIAACQIGITLSSLILGAYGQATIPGEIAPLFEDLGGMRDTAAQSVSAIIVLAFLTTVQMVFGELVPKSLALQYPTRVALLTTLPMQWSLVAFRWFIAVLNGSGLALLRLIGAKEAKHVRTHSPEEIELLIVQSADGGLLEPEEQSRLRRALQLRDRAAREIMVPRGRVFAVDLDEPVEETVRKVTSSPYTRVPAYRESIDNLVGILHTRDLVVVRLRGAWPASLEELVRPALTLPESLPVDQLLASLRLARARQAILIDEYGGVAGLVTIEDVLAGLFGDLGDEFKAATTKPQQTADGCYTLPGSMPADDAAVLLGIEWTGVSSTVGGMVTETLGALAEGGETVAIGGAELRVEEVRHRAVTLVTARPAHPRAEEDED